MSSPVARSTSTTPSSRSRRATWVDTFDWTVWSWRAAAEKLPGVGHGEQGGELAEIHRF